MESNQEQSKAKEDARRRTTGSKANEKKPSEHQHHGGEDEGSGKAQKEYRFEPEGCCRLLTESADGRVQAIAEEERDEESHKSCAGRARPKLICPQWLCLEGSWCCLAASSCLLVLEECTGPPCLHLMRKHKWPGRQPAAARQDRQAHVSGAANLLPHNPQAQAASAPACAAVLCSASC